jgi:hypothetical protein
MNILTKRIDFKKDCIIIIILYTCAHSLCTMRLYVFVHPNFCSKNIYIKLNFIIHFVASFCMCVCVFVCARSLYIYGTHPTRPVPCLCVYIRMSSFSYYVILCSPNPMYHHLSMFAVSMHVHSGVCICRHEKI